MFPTWMYNCELEHRGYGYTWFRVIDLIIFASSDVACDVIVILQAYEWMCMDLVIALQRGRAPDEVLFDLNNENMKEWLSWRDFFGSQANKRPNFKRREICLKYFLIFLSIILIPAIFAA